MSLTIKCKINDRQWCYYGSDDRDSRTGLTGLVPAGAISTHMLTSRQITWLRSHISKLPVYCGPCVDTFTGKPAVLKVNQAVWSAYLKTLLTNPKARRQRPWLPLQWLLHQLSSHLLSEGHQTCLLFQLLQGQARRCTRETQACVPLGTPSTSGGEGSLLQVRVWPTMAAVQVHTCRSYLATCTWITSNVINRIKESAKRPLIAVGCAEQIQAGRTPYQFCLMVIFYVDLNTSSILCLQYSLSESSGCIVSFMILQAVNSRRDEWG